MFCAVIGYGEERDASSVESLFNKESMALWDTNIESDPADHASRIHLIAANMYHQNIERAYHYAQSGAEEFPNVVEYAYYLMAILTETGEYEETITPALNVIRWYEEGFDGYPEAEALQLVTNAYCTLGFAYSVLNDEAGMIDAYQWVLLHSHDSPNNFDLALYTYIQIALYYGEVGEHEKMVSAIEDYLHFLSNEIGGIYEEICLQRSDMTEMMQTVLDGYRASPDTFFLYDYLPAS